MKNKDLTICVHGVFKVSAHPVIAVLLLHGVWVEESDDGARVRLPKLPVNLTEQQQGDEHLQVVEVVQLPDAEGFALQRGSAQSETGQGAMF